MPLFCCYSDVELAANEMQVEAHEKPQFRLKMVNLGEENPRKWYQSSPMTFVQCRDLRYI